MEYVYRLEGEGGSILYVGRTKDIDHRMRTHNHLPIGAYKSVKSVSYKEVDYKGDADIVERYYIGKYKPRYNTLLLKDVTEGIVITDDWKDYKGGIDRERLNSRIVNLISDIESVEGIKNSLYIDLELISKMDISKEYREHKESEIVKVESLLYDMNDKLLELTVGTLRYRYMSKEDKLEYISKGVIEVTLLDIFNSYKDSVSSDTHSKEECKVISYIEKYKVIEGKLLIDLVDRMVDRKIVRGYTEKEMKDKLKDMLVNYYRSIYGDMEVLSYEDG